MLVCATTRLSVGVMVKWHIYLIVALCNVTSQMFQILHVNEILLIFLENYTRLKVSLWLVIVYSFLLWKELFYKLNKSI
jgi:hypothetical protein